HGVNMYDYSARYKDEWRFTTVDPLAEKYYSWSPYTYVMNNPLKYIDPTGMAPVYDENGNLIGTTEDGLQGDAIFMNVKNFTQGMSNKDASKYNIGMDALGDKAKESYLLSFSGLKDRPDYDGIITLSEANEWYRNGNGQPLYVDVSKIDLKGVDITMLKIGEEQGYNFKLLNGANSSTGLVYGTLAITLLDEQGNVSLVPNKYSSIGAIDDYSFEMREGQPLRNVATVLGQTVAGGGNSFLFKGYGNAKIQTKPHKTNPFTGHRY
ncbi:MAG: hypothetical protein E6767_20835, partial [Dysgonomonas sp.]|nr:hypothetical protein [Dysgonomonas sp.]